MEDGGRARRQRRGHEAQFNEGPHVNRQEEVDDLIGIEEGIERRLVVFDARAEVVGQESVTAQVLKSQLGMTLTKL
jgi:hypothetical protein